MSFPTRRIRTARGVQRGISNSSVTDFSIQVVGKCADNEDLCISTIKRAQSEGSFFTRNHHYNTTAASTITYTTIEKAGRNNNLSPVIFDTPRITLKFPDELYGHFTKSANTRSRLSGKKQLRLMETSPRGWANPWQDVSTPFSSSNRFPSGKDSLSPRKTRHMEFKAQQCPRLRPAATGRYFDSSKGLCPSLSRTSPPTLYNDEAVGPGLMIQKINLVQKNTSLIRSY